MKRWTPRELQSLQQDSTRSPVLVDVRSREEFENGHVEGARHISLNELAQRASELPQDRPVVTYCNMLHPGSSRGEQATVQLTELNFDAGVLQGGFPAWREAGVLVENGEPEV